MKDCDRHSTPASNHFLRKPAFVNSGTKNGPGIRARFWSLLVLAQLPKAQKTGPFLGPHFGAGKPLLSSFLELQNLDTDREIPSNATSSSLDAAG